jgi:dsRNA-specific ribonuclease
MKALPPKFHHDLLDAAARVVSLEVRLGYTFKNRLTCIEALKTTGEWSPIYCDGTVYDVSRNNRLALLGDRVLSLAVCEIWFQTEHSTKEHSKMSSDTVSRIALAVAGRALELSEAILAAPTASLGKNQIAEAFEAVLGAIYVDSNYSMEAVKTVLKKLRLDDHQFLKTREQLLDEEEDQTTIKVVTQQTTKCKSQHTQDDPIFKPGHDSSQDAIHQSPGDTANGQNAQVHGGVSDKNASKTKPLSKSHSAPTVLESKNISLSPYRLEIERLKRLTETGSPERKKAASKALDTYSKRQRQGELINPLLAYREMRRQMGRENDRQYVASMKSMKAQAQVQTDVMSKKERAVLEVPIQEFECDKEVEKAVHGAKEEKVAATTEEQTQLGSTRTLKRAGARARGNAIVGEKATQLAKAIKLEKKTTKPEKKAMELEK